MSRARAPPVPTTARTTRTHHAASGTYRAMMDGAIPATWPEACRAPLHSDGCGEVESYS